MLRILRPLTLRFSLVGRISDQPICRDLVLAQQLHPRGVRARAWHHARDVFDEMRERGERKSGSLLRRAVECTLHHRCSETDDASSIISSLHAFALKSAALSDVSMSTSFLTLYARAGHLEASWSLFNDVAAKDVICWNAMVSACVYSNRFNSAVALFGRMLTQLADFDSTTLVILLTVSSSLHDLKLGEMIHGMSLKLEDGSGNPNLTNAMLDMYCKCGELDSALCVFKGRETIDVISWNSMISGFLHNGFPEHALFYFRKMNFSNARPDNVNISCSIAACSSLVALDAGMSLHSFAIKLGYNRSSCVSVDNALISFYAKCDFVESAETVFREVECKDVISWNSMIGGLAEAGQVADTFHFLGAMLSTEAVHLDSATLVSILPLCGAFNLLREGRALHGFAVRRALVSPLSVKNSILDMYVKCGWMRTAEVLFQSIVTKDLVSWNTMINGYSHQGRLIEAKILFCELLQCGHRCSLSTALAILPSCNSSESIQFTNLLHSWMIKSGYLQHLSVVNALICTYVNCGDLENPLSLLKCISLFADVASWNSMIVSCTQNENHREALEVFNLMRGSSDIYPDSIMLISILSASGSLKLGLNVKLVHSCAHKMLMDDEVRVRNALITAYCRCGKVDIAEKVFLTYPEKNLCTWNCMLTGFTQNVYSYSSLELFRHLEFQPNEMTYASVLSACTQLGILRHGREIHAHIIRLGFHDNGYILSALIDLYSKCGRLEAAALVFNDPVEKSVVAWNSMISGYACHGYGEKAIELFKEMCKLKMVVTKSSFVALLSACGYTGFVNEGCYYYDRMTEDFGVEPSTEHYVCMVDMLGRAGRLREAYEFIQQIPRQLAAGVLGALLSACKDHGDVEMGKNVAEQLFVLEPENVGYYVSLSNAYAGAGRWMDAGQVRERLRTRCLVKPVGCSHIDLSIATRNVVCL